MYSVRHRQRLMIVVSSMVTTLFMYCLEIGVMSWKQVCYYPASSRFEYFMSSSRIGPIGGLRPRHLCVSADGGAELRLRRAPRARHVHCDNARTRRAMAHAQQGVQFDANVEEREEPTVEHAAARSRCVRGGPECL